LLPDSVIDLIALIVMIHEVSILDGVLKVNANCSDEVVILQHIPHLTKCFNFLDE